MTDRNFTITVRGYGNNRYSVEGTLSRAWNSSATDLQAPPSTIVVDPLHLSTVELLDKWLKRWEWIARVEKDKTNINRRQLLVPETFSVLGTLLWELILRNSVGDKLDEYRQAASDARQSLRVLITFDKAAQDLAGLPWEFLHRKDREGSPGYFLATETNLVLSRYMWREKGRPTMRAATGKLRIILWLMLPEGDEYEADRTACLNTRDALMVQLDDRADVRPPIIGWHPKEVEEQLGTKADIVHLVGVYRRVNDRFQIMMPDGSYASPDELVRSLVGTEENRPELVVLHLCDAPERVPAENFERLAPLLVQRGIPAVLAMQYPMEPGDTDQFIRKFYEVLVESNDVGKAVQAARAQGGSEQRRFGAPVLYLQSLESNLLGDGDGVVADVEPQAGPTSVGVGIRSAPIRSEATPAGLRPRSDIKKQMLDVVALSDSDRGAIQTVQEWIGGQDWPSDRRAAEMLVLSGNRDHLDDPALRPLFADMRRALWEVA